MRLIAFIVIAAVIGLNNSGLRAQDLNVKKWPDDVPCDAVKKNPDGSYSQLKDLMMGSMPMPKKTYTKDSAETRSWDRKCAGKTG